jgi:hypothetical protein
MSNGGKHDFGKENGHQSAILKLNPNLIEPNESRKKTKQLWFRK